MIDLSLVVPAYSEEAVLEQSLRRIHTFLSDHDIITTTEVIVVTADCTDKTQEIAAREIMAFPHGQHLQPGPKVGKGRDVQLGMLAAKGELVIFTDADLATPLHHIPPMIDALKKGADVVLGQRDLSDIHRGFRYYISNVSNILIQLILLPGIKDSQCGFKGFTKAANEDIFKRVSIMQWGFDMEVIKIAREHKLTIATVPILDWSDPKVEEGLTGESPLSAVIKTFKELWQIRINSWSGRYS